MRQKLYNVINGVNQTPLSIAYNTLMGIAIILSIIPLMFRQSPFMFEIFEMVSFTVFVLDYIARWFTADFRTGKSSLSSFIAYPFTAWAIVDLLTILPSLSLINRGFITLRVARLIKIIRVFKVFKFTNHIELIARVLKAESSVLSNVLGLCIIYIFVTALIVFNYEEGIENFVDALYWATAAITSMEYGELFPINDVGKIISMISSLFGIAIIALPSGIITARYLDEIYKAKEK